MHQPFYKSRRADGQAFYCPNGHARVYRETDVQKLEKALAKEEQRRKWAEENAERAESRAANAERSRIALKGHLTKVKKRVGNGVCPCCTRCFQNLAAHMKNQHPNYQHQD